MGFYSHQPPDCPLITEAICGLWDQDTEHLGLGLYQYYTGLKCSFLHTALHLSHSDHISVFATPAYKPRQNMSEHSALQDCFRHTDWDVQHPMLTSSTYWSMQRLWLKWKATEDSQGMFADKGPMTRPYRARDAPRRHWIEDSRQWNVSMQRKFRDRYTSVKQEKPEGCGKVSKHRWATKTGSG